LSSLRRWLRGETREADGPPPRPPAPAQLSGRLTERLARRRAEESSPRLLIAGTTPGPLIEGFSQLGARVTVDGEERPSLPLGYADETFELLLAFDLLDHLDDQAARGLGAEWARVLRRGGCAYLIARAPEAARGRPLRIEMDESGGLWIAERDEAAAVPVRGRGNRALETLVAPLELDAICLRRDGMREILFRRPSGRG
jgi:SAM-dependent methyltransferase